MTKKDAIFDSAYSELYDSVYGDKDYDRECRVILDVLSLKLPHAHPNVLDIGCGTGQHAIRLAKSGARVVGVDRSPSMLAIAREKAFTEESSACFLEADIRSMDLGETFDAALMMFAVLGYMATPEDLHLALSSTRRHLSYGGVFLFDVWYAPAVENLRPGPRVKTISHGEKTIIRDSRGHLDPEHHTCTISIATRLVDDEVVYDESFEEHVMRYFDREELVHLLASHGFILRSLQAFPDVYLPASNASWNVFGVADVV